MAYTPDEQYVMGLMAREASMGRDGSSELTEYQRNEAAVFAAMAMDKENRQETTLLNNTKENAKLIYSRVSGILKNPMNVRDVYVGILGERVVKHPSEDTLKECCAIGYYMPMDRTVYDETQHALSITVRDLKNMGFEEEAQKFEQKSAEVEQTMLNIALPIIEGGLVDGSIQSDLAYKSDEEIVEILASSDGTKETEIQQSFTSTVKNVYMEMAHSKFDAQCALQDRMEEDAVQE